MLFVLTVFSMSETEQISQEKTQESKDFFHQVVDQTNSIGTEISKALKSIKDANARTHMLSTTAKIEANRTGDIGRDFLVVSNSIDELSTQTDSAIERMKSETLSGIEQLASVIEKKSIVINGNRLANLALTNIRLVDRNLFERSADIRWWATDNILVSSLTENTEEKYADAEKRLTKILNAYPTYYDLILCDTHGNCKATAESKFGLVGRNFANKDWFKNAINTENGSKFGFQSVHHSPKINDDYTLVFSCKVHEDGNPNNQFIGVLAAIFKWREFSQRIVNETALTEEDRSKTRVLLCDDVGNVLADSKEKILQEKINFIGRNDLFKKDKGFLVEKKTDRIQLISHALSPGYEGYQSTKWHSLIIQELGMEFKDVDCSDSDSDDSLDSVANLVANLSNETQKATSEINKINDQTQILALNAAIEAARVGDEGRGFGVISGFMGDLSRQTADVTNSMDAKTQEKLHNLNDFLLINSKQIKGNRLANLSLTNIDLVDRSLSERTADVRWWATDQSLVKALTLKTDESLTFLESRLHTLLQYYTVYEDLIVTDNDGNVIASGTDHNFFGTNVSNEQWFQNVKITKNGQKFSFDIITHTDNKQEQTKLVFSCKVHKDGNPAREEIGVLAIVFKWEQFASILFNETPLSDLEQKSTSLYITDNGGNFLALSDKNDGKVTQKDLLSLHNGTKNFDVVSIGDEKFLSGHAASVGYEGFSTGWHSFITHPEVKE